MNELRLAAMRIGLPAWFIAIDLLWVAKPEVLGIDARHYQRAAAAWLGGADPWLVTEQGVGFAPGPHTLLFYAPTSVLPVALAELVWMALGVAASVWLVRRLGLPIWWVLFPPLTHSIWNGNPQTIVLALLVAGGTVPAVVAVALKAYAGLVLLFRPKDLVIAGLALLVTLPVLPWELYLRDASTIASYLVGSWNGSAWRIPILIPPTLVALWILRRNGAEWFAVPAVWPSIQFYYVAMALPAVAQRPMLAAAFALPVPLLVPLTVMVLAVRLLLAGRIGEEPNGGVPAGWRRRLVWPIR